MLNRHFLVLKINILHQMEEEKHKKAVTEHNENKIALHNDKLNGLEYIRLKVNTEGRNPISVFVADLRKIIVEAKTKHPRLAEGLFSRIKKFFDEVAPGWDVSVTSVPQTQFSAGKSKPEIKLFKIVLFGCAQVGKSSVLARFVKNTFLPEENYEATVGVDFNTKDLKDEDGIVRLQIWDASGKERYYSVAKAYLRGASLAILMFDIANKDSIANENPFDRIDAYRKDVLADVPDVQFILVGNKSDLADKRQVTTEEAEAYAKNNGMIYHEVSAKDNVQIEELFKKVVQQLKEKPSAAPANTF